MSKSEAAAKLGRKPKAPKVPVSFYLSPGAMESLAVYVARAKAVARAARVPLPSISEIIEVALGQQLRRPWDPTKDR